MVEQKPSKLTTRVRFPSPAPKFGHLGDGLILEALTQWRGDNSSGSLALTRRTCAATWRACRIATPATRWGGWSVTSLCGEVAEWLKAADCKSARASVRWFESSPLHHFPFERPRATQGSSPRPGMKTSARGQETSIPNESRHAARNCYRRLTPKRRKIRGKLAQPSQMT